MSDRRHWRFITPTDRVPASVIARHAGPSATAENVSMSGVNFTHSVNGTMLYCVPKPKPAWGPQTGTQ